MRDDPGLDLTTIAACLERNYDLRVDAIRFLAIGFDATASVYEVEDAGGTSFFLKLRAGPVNEPGLIVPKSLIDAGVANTLAPFETVVSPYGPPLGWTVALTRRSFAAAQDDQGPGYLPYDMGSMANSRI